MALYESVIIGRQDLTPGQFETLLEKFIAVIQSLKGEIKKRENWGIRNLAYKINKNRKSSVEKNKVLRKSKNTNKSNKKVELDAYFKTELLKTK